MKPTDLYLLPVLLAVLMATPSEGQAASTYSHHMLRSNSTNPIIAYSSTADVTQQIKPINTMVVPEVTEVSTTEGPAKSKPSTVGQGITEESVTVQAEDGVNEEDSSEEEDEEVVDENSATEEVDETKKE